MGFAITTPFLIFLIMDNKYLDAKLKLPGGCGVSGQRDLKDAIDDNGANKFRLRQVSDKLVSTDSRGPRTACIIGRHVATILT